METITVKIEIPMNSAPVKYEADDNGEIHLDRFLETSMFYPTNYGYIPNTLAPDGDPVDVLVVSPFPLISGCVVRCRPIGVLKMEDEEGQDDKILAVPDDPMYEDWTGLESAPKFLRKQLLHFFQHYKDLSDGGWCDVVGWEGIGEAEEVIKYGKLNGAKSIIDNYKPKHSSEVNTFKISPPGAISVR